MYIYGKNPIFEYLKNRKKDIKRVYTCDLSLKREIENKYSIPVIEKDKNFIIAKLDNSNSPHQNLLAELEMSNLITIETLIDKTLNSPKKHRTIIILDHLSDPHNFGAIIRSAVFFNVSGIILAKDRQAPLSPAVIKTSSGMASLTDFSIVANINNAIEKLKKNNFWIYAATASEGISPEKIDTNLPICLIAGNEGEGPKNLTLKSADFKISIQGNPEVESLNVSVSTAILLYQINFSANK